MEERLDAWLKTYRAEKLISPVDWETIPDDCRLQLDNYARDAAVRRADSFAHDGFLDLHRQDAVRQLVDAMAQNWRLPGEDVRRVVEDYYDALPPKPGMEFYKLATRLFRRNVSASASEVFNGFDPKEEHKVIKASAKYMDVPPNQVLDRTGFLRACYNAYDTWTTKQPRDAVAELLKTVKIKGDAIPLGSLLGYLELRGARTWATALKLEQDIGVEKASQDELIRILKRYALMVRRGGLQAIGLSEQPPVPEASQVDEPAVIDKSVSNVVEQDIATDELNEPSTEEIPEPELEDQPDALKDETETDSHDDMTEDVQEEVTYEAPSLKIKEVQETEEESSKIDDNSEQDDLISTEPEPQAEDDLEVEIETPDESGETMIKDPNKFQVRALDNLDDDDLEAIEYLFGENAIQYEDDSEEDGDGEDDDEDSIIAGGTTNGMQMSRTEEVRSVRDDFRSPEIKTSHLRKDRFIKLRSGKLRSSVIRSVYGNDEKQFDIFLAKLSSTSDWKSGKKVIAEEMLDKHVNLEDEPARELFFALKRCMQTK